MNSRHLLWLLGILLIASEPGRAQGKTSLFSGPVTISTGYENVIGPGGGTVAERSLLVTPIRPMLVKNTPRSNFRLSYTPEFEYLKNGTRELTFWNHAAELAYTHAFGRRTTFDLGHSFVRSSDPARLFADNLFVLPRNNFRENATAVTVRHDFTRYTTLGLRFDNTITRISGPERVSGTYLDEYGVVGTVALTRHLSEHQRVTGSYSMLKFSPYRFLTETDASGFLATVPTVRAGVSRFALTLALQASESATAPTGMMGGTAIGNPLSPGSPTGEGSISGGIVAPPPSAGAVEEEPAPGSSPNTQAKFMGDPFHTVALTYGLERAGLVFEATGGVIADRDASYIFGTQIEKRLSRFWVAVGAHHYLSYYGPTPVAGFPTGASTVPLAAGTRARSTFTAGMFTIGVKPARRTELELSAVASESKANFVVHHTRSLIGRARVSHWFTDRIGIFAMADSFSEDRNEIGSRDFDRQRYFGGLQFRLSQPPRPTRPTER
jgi:hypothetical protein